MIDSTIFPGDAEHNSCLRRYGLMAIHVYNNLPAFVAPALRDQFALMDKLAQNLSDVVKIN